MPAGQKTGWLNKADTDSKRSQKAPGWKLHRAVLKGSQLSLFKPPADIGIKYFDFTTTSASRSAGSSPSMVPLPSPKETSFASSTLASTIPYTTLGTNNAALSQSPSNTSSLASLNSNCSNSMSTSPSMSSITNSVSATSLSTAITSSVSISVSSPDIHVTDLSNLEYASVEAICHCIVFENDLEFVKDALLLLPLWTDFASALDRICQYALLQNYSIRIAFVIDFMIDRMTSCLYDPEISRAFLALLETLNFHRNSRPVSPITAPLEYDRPPTDLYAHCRSHLDMKMVFIRTILRPSHPPNQEYVDQLRHGFTADFLLNVDIDLLAAQIHIFDLNIFKSWSPLTDFSLLYALKYSSCRKNPLIFTSSQPHFLGSTLVHHIFPQVGQPPSFTLASALLCRWVILGSTLKQRGDMVGWLGIATIVCSPAISRLRHVWSLTPADIISIVVHDWAPVMFDLDRRIIVSTASHRRESAHILAPDGIGQTYRKESVVPFFGDVTLHCFDKISECDEKEREIEVASSRSQLHEILKSIDRWDTYISGISNTDDIPDIAEQPIAAFQDCLYNIFEAHINSPPVSTSNLLEMSLSYEPKSSGVYAQYYSVQRSSLSTGSYAALLFTEVISTYKLFAQKDALSAGGLLYSKKSSTSLRSKASAEHLFVSSQSLKQQTYDFGSGAQLSSSGPSHGHSNSAGSRHLRRASSFPPSRTTINITGYSDLDTNSRSRVAALTNRSLLVKTVRDVLNLNVTVYRLNNDLVLKSFRDEQNRSSRSSRLSSVMIENPSKRMSSGSRRLSVQMHASAINQSGYDTSSSVSENRKSYPLVVSVVTKSGTFDRLVDILVLGVGDFSSKVHSEDLYYLHKVVDGQASINMDMDIYTSTFFATYRSFCSPMTLLEALCARFVGAKSAAAFANKENSFKYNDIFPDWFANSHVADEFIDLPYMGRIQIGILEACNLWTSEYYMDFVNEVNIRDRFLQFLQTVDKETQIWKLRATETEDLRYYAESISALSRKVRKAFVRKSYRPVDLPLSSLPSHPIGGRPMRFPDCSRGSIDYFCSAIDSVVGSFMRQIRLKEWLDVVEIFEMQTVDPLRLFSERNFVTSSDEDIVILDIFGFCANLRSSKTDELMVSYLPKPVKKLYAFRMNLVLWITMQVCEPTLRCAVRVSRMITLLYIVAVCRQRMNAAEFSHSVSSGSRPPSVVSDDFKKRTEPHFMVSFIESAVAAAIVRPESRQYAAAWLNAARELYGPTMSQIETLEEIIPRLSTKTSKYVSAESPLAMKPLMPCVGWVFERLFEIICYVPNMAVENPKMINFDKQRYIYNLLSNVLEMAYNNVDLTNDRPNEDVLFSISSSELASARLDKRLVKEAASREIKELSMRGSKNLKVFQALVSQEQEKIRRDLRQCEALDRQYGRDTSRYSSGSLLSPTGASANSPSLQPSYPTNRLRVPSATIDRRPSSRPSRLGGLLRAVRPISMAFTSGWSPPSPDRTVTSKFDLPDANSIESKNKPVMIINLLTAGISVPAVSKGMGIFKITSEDGGEVFFQAPDEIELEEWMKCFAYARSNLVDKFSPLSEDSGHANSTKIFGVPIGDLCHRENQLVPSVVEILLQEIESRGLEEVGIYRVPGSLASVNALKYAFDSGISVSMDDERWFDINTVAGCLKLYLRELPEPLLTYELFPEFMAIAKLPTELDQIFEFIRVVRKLPINNYYLLKRIVTHLALISKHGDVNKMHAVNLAIVFSMSLLPNGNPFAATSDLGAIQTVLRAMISYPDRIFREDFGDDPGSSGESSITHLKSRSFISNTSNLAKSLPESDDTLGTKSEFVKVNESEGLSEAPDQREIVKQSSSFLAGTGSAKQRKSVTEENVLASVDTNSQDRRSNPINTSGIQATQSVYTDAEPKRLSLPEAQFL
ncbi:hypothetical protein V1511DRAFT_461621 [Dipodascopsis uninucleata]